MSEGNRSDAESILNIIWLHLQKLLGCTHQLKLELKFSILIFNAQSYTATRWHGFIWKSAPYLDTTQLTIQTTLSQNFYVKIMYSLSYLTERILLRVKYSSKPEGDTSFNTIIANAKQNFGPCCFKHRRKTAARLHAAVTQI